VTLLRRFVAAIVSLIVACFGLAISYDCYYLYFEETKNPYYVLPFWKEALIFILLLVSALAPLLLAYKFLRYALKLQSDS